MADIPVLLEKSEFFVSSLKLDFDPIAYQCMEEWLLQRIHSKNIVSMAHYCNQNHLKSYINHAHCL